MLGIFHDKSFIHDNLLLLILDNHFFLDELHGVELVIVLGFAEEDFGETSRSNLFY